MHIFTHLHNYSVLKQPDCVPGQIITAPLQNIMFSGRTFTPVHYLINEKSSNEMFKEYDIYLGKTSNKNVGFFCDKMKTVIFHYWHINVALLHLLKLKFLIVLVASCFYISFPGYSVAIGHFNADNISGKKCAFGDH